MVAAGVDLGVRNCAAAVSSVAGCEGGEAGLTDRDGREDGRGYGEERRVSSELRCGETAAHTHPARAEQRAAREQHPRFQELQVQEEALGGPTETGRMPQNSTSNM